MTGEKIPGDLASWDYFGTDPNELLKLNYNLLCQRSTTLFHTHPPVSAAIKKTSTYAIGSGLAFRSQPDWKTLGVTKEYAKEWGMEFQKLIHYMFTLLNFYNKQSVQFQTADIMGDSLLFFDYDTPAAGMPFDLIEAGGDQINFQATPKGTEQITLGIIHDKFLRKTGIVQDDAAQTRVYFQDENGDQQIIQYYNKQMARQLRGFPLSYKIISPAKNNDRWWDATLARAVMESLILGTAKNTDSDIRQQIDSMVDSVRNEDGSAPPSGITTTATASQLNPGNILQLHGKGSIEFTDLKTPSNNFDKMQNAYIEIVGMATDVPPECVKSMYSTSYTAHKGALNDFVKAYMIKRNNFINTVNYPVIREIAKYLFMERLIDMPNPQFFKNPIIQMATLAGTWLGPVPGHINPLQEINALVLAKDNALTTPADAAAQFGGGEWDDFIEEWYQQMKEFKKLGIEQQTAIMQQQEESLNSQDEEEDSDGQPEAKVKNTGEIMSITSPMGNFDFQVRKRTIKKTVNYVDINGKEKQAEIIEEEI